MVWNLPQLAGRRIGGSWSPSSMPIWSGYSRLIGLDDAGTLERLRTLRKNLIDPAIEEHGGRLVNTGAILCSSCSTASMGRCAVP